MAEGDSVAVAGSRTVALAIVAVAGTAIVAEVYIGAGARMGDAEDYSRDYDMAVESSHMAVVGIRSASWHYSYGQASCSFREAASSAGPTISSQYSACEATGDGAGISTRRHVVLTWAMVHSSPRAVVRYAARNVVSCVSSVFSDRRCR